MKLHEAKKKSPTSAGIERKTSGFDRPLLYRLSYEGRREQFGGVNVKGTNECFVPLALRTQMMDQRINSTTTTKPREEKHLQTVGHPLPPPPPPHPHTHTHTHPIPSKCKKLYLLPPVKFTLPSHILHLEVFKVYERYRAPTPDFIERNPKSVNKKL